MKKPESMRGGRGAGDAEGVSAAAQALLGLWHEVSEGSEQDHVKVATFFLTAADQGDARVQLFVVGKIYASGEEGVKKNLPLGKMYLELSAARGDQDAVTLLEELRKCVACGELDVHHMVCSRCRNRRYCSKGCQLQHWNSPTDSHKLHCVKRREAAGAGGGSDRVEPLAHLNQIAATAAARGGGGGRVSSVGGFSSGGSSSSSFITDSEQCAMMVEALEVSMTATAATKVLAAVKLVAALEASMMAAAATKAEATKADAALEVSMMATAKVEAALEVSMAAVAAAAEASAVMKAGTAKMKTANVAADAAHVAAQAAMTAVTVAKAAMLAAPG